MVVEGAVVPPLVEVAPDGALGREVLGQVAPLAAGAQDVEDGIDDVAQVGLAGPAAGVDGDVRLDQGPLRVGHVAGILMCFSSQRLMESTPYGTGPSPTAVVSWAAVRDAFGSGIPAPGAGAAAATRTTPAPAPPG